MGLTQVLIVVPAVRLCVEEDLNVLVVWAPALTLQLWLRPKAPGGRKQILWLSKGDHPAIIFVDGR